jgi:mRNA interferase YafQ
VKNLFSDNRFKKDLKRCASRGCEKSKFDDVLTLLLKGERLPDKCRLHKLKGDWDGYWECHIDPDWLLIWLESDVDITLVRTGSHNDLF